MPVRSDDRLDNSSWEKRYLKALFLLQLENGPVEMTELAREVGESSIEVGVALSRLMDMCCVVKTLEAPITVPDEGRSSVGPRERFTLSEEGRGKLLVVMTGGVFDILHVGHLSSFEEGRGLGDLLIVVIARDSTVQRLKHRTPINNESQRMRLVNALSVVDLAVLGDEDNFLNSVEKIDPDIIAVGYDQAHNTNKLKEDLRLRGLKARVIRLESHIPGIKSSKILSRIQDANSLN
ncbi:MAG: FAD synthase [Candidatus Bathyarchaeota archaeon]|nr:MAG: FAD synthase [Candidatus Bathyarchaeota archaeon]